MVWQVGDADLYIVGMQYVDSLLDLIGNTPLLRLSRSLDDLAGAPTGPMVLAKVEIGRASCRERVL